jgi:hypothetical protein
MSYKGKIKVRSIYKENLSINRYIYGKREKQQQQRGKNEGLYNKNETLAI